VEGVALGRLEGRVIGRKDEVGTDVGVVVVGSIVGGTLGAMDDFAVGGLGVDFGVGTVDDFTAGMYSGCEGVAVVLAVVGFIFDGLTIEIPETNNNIACECRRLFDAVAEYT